MALWIWLVLAILAVIGEVLTIDLWLASVALGALVAAGIAIALGTTVQVIVFASVTLTGMFVLRPTVKHALGIDSASHHLLSPTHDIAGRRAVVTQTVDGRGGQVRIGQGEFWSARAFDPEESIQIGAPVEVVLIDGLTALVEPVESLPEEAPPEVSSKKGNI